jgi:hypothetical protein
MNDVRQRDLHSKGLLLLSEEQKHLRSEFDDDANVRVLIQPVKYRQLTSTMAELLQVQAAAE